MMVCESNNGAFTRFFNLLPRPLRLGLQAGSYGFEYSDEDMSEGAVDIENQYYNSKGSI
jgi:hypothetical protein